jgi:hypothetical protein
MQDELKKSTPFLRIAMKKAIIPHSPEPFGEHMLQQEVEEILTFQGPEPSVSGSAFDVLESDLPVFVGDNVLFTENTTVKIPG